LKAKIVYIGKEPWKELEKPSIYFPHKVTFILDGLKFNAFRL